MRPLLVLLAISVLLSVSAVAGDEKDKPAVKPHTDKQIKEGKVLERFRQDYASKDMDRRLRIVKWLGMWRHKVVVKELKKIWLKEPNFELRAVAAEGLGQQKPFEKDVGKMLVQGLVAMKDLASRPEPDADEELLQRFEARTIVNGLRALGGFGKSRAWNDGWKKLKGYIEHEHDDVAAEMMLVCGRVKEYRALPILLDWFNYYPDGYSWSGGSVKVDTGAAGTKDARAAKAKWKAKYGRAKKARPMVWEKMVEAVRMLTGETFSKPKELSNWMKENKLLLRKHGA